eukprot:CAMPEP_0204562042 /NCGR_PEP_ID=MMETSP0661-20131031/33530_1 /ASSEMBLY_ACC=CAM_ASM_000606 /TAXON_ID=109239 /ORGANISM="Alexandrium margalefi, Strain AMGDE01CS-322" /LENGTH=414 /DNA_ID=CAMNT_0051569505 /DNA_START=1 /DNA_END=1245 /DNA_ORIENTATION=-
MLLSASQGDGQQGMGEDIWELSRAVLSQLLDNCEVMKYPILKAFSENLVSSSVSLRPSFLAALLEQSRQGHEKTEVEQFLNSPDNPHRQDGGGAERAVISVKMQVLVGGKFLVVQNSRDPEGCFLCMVTNKGFYIIDATAPGFPTDPTVVQFRTFVDMTRLIKGQAPQALFVGWTTGSSDEQLNEQFMTLICYSENHRDELFMKLHQLSEPPGGNVRHRALTQNDSNFRLVLESKVEQTPLLKAFVRVDDKLELAVLGESRLFLISVNFEFWTPPLEDTEEEAEDAAVEDENMPQAKKGAGRQEGTEADKVKERRTRAIMRFESGLPGDSQNMSAYMMRLKENPRELRDLERTDFFYSEKQPRMALVFGDEEVDMVFLDDTTRERWRRSLAKLLEMEESPNWSHPHEGAHSLTQ